jgi:hypothetical protein
MTKEDMTDRQIAIRVNRIAREIYGCPSHEAVAIKRDTLEYSAGDAQGIRHQYRDNDNILVLGSYLPYAGTSWKDAAEVVRDHLGL